MIKILANENLHTEIVKKLREAKYEVLFVPEIGLAGHSDEDILSYSEKHNLVIISGDKDFGGLIEFGGLWGRGKVILLRYRIMDIRNIVSDILKVLTDEAKILESEKPVVIVLSEAGFRIHRPGESD